MARRAAALAVIREHAGRVAFGFRLEVRELLAVGVPTRQQWLECLHFLMMLECHVHFWLGDLMIYGEAQWGEGAVRRLVETTGYSYETLRNDKWVARAVHASRRRPTLSFSHHEAVAELSPSQQREVLARAEQERWTRDEVRQEAYRRKHPVERPQQLTLDPHVHHGDCREVLTALPDASIDLLLTDPPYGIDYESPTRIIPFPRMAGDNQGATTLLHQAFERVAPKLKPNTPVCVFTSWKTLREMIEVIASHFPVHSTLSWAKNVWGVGDCRGNYGDQHELVIFAPNGLRRLPGRAIRCDRVGTNQRQHATQKPVPLLRSLIDELTEPGATVLDPFMGSGSTCVAARDAGRRFIGIEMDQEYYERALQRLAGPTPEDVSDIAVEEGCM